jgi:hypothetical protein
MIIIIDIDENLIDSTLSTELLETEQWEEAYEMIHRFTPNYETIGWLKRQILGGCNVVVYTKYTEKYANKICHLHRIPYNYCIGHIDEKRKKPSIEICSTVIARFNESYSSTHIVSHFVDDIVYDLNKESITHIKKILLFEDLFKTDHLLDLKTLNDWFYQKEFECSVVVPIICLGSYYPSTRVKAQEIPTKLDLFRKYIWNFKDGNLTDKEQVDLSNRIHNLLKINNIDFDSCDFIPIPASTFERTRKRYSSFPKIICDTIDNLEDGANLIQRVCDEEQKHLTGVRTSSTKGLTFIDNKLRKRPVILFDDVITTGATVSAIVNYLNNIDCKVIAIVCLGKTTNHIEDCKRLVSFKHSIPNVEIQGEQKTALGTMALAAIHLKRNLSVLGEFINLQSEIEELSDPWRATTSIIDYRKEISPLRAKFIEQLFNEIIEQHKESSMFKNKSKESNHIGLSAVAMIATETPSGEYSVVTATYLNYLVKYSRYITQEIASQDKLNQTSNMNNQIFMAHSIKVNHLIISFGKGENTSNGNIPGLLMELVLKVNKHLDIIFQETNASQDYLKLADYAVGFFMNKATEYLNYMSQGEMGTDVLFAQISGMEYGGTLFDITLNMLVACENIVMSEKKRKELTSQIGVLMRNKKEAEGGCYIATMTYGSHDHPQVLMLREYRDKTLAKTAFGRSLIYIYYRLSPAVVKYVGDSKTPKYLSKIFLDSIIKRIQ